MAWPYDDKIDLLATLGEQPPAPSPQVLGALAEPDTGGLARQGGLMSRVGQGINRFSTGLDKVLSHPLYSRLWNGAVGGMTGDPSAGPRMQAEMQRAQAPSMREELDMYRVRQFQRQETEALQKDELKSQLSEYLAAGDTEKARGVAAQLFPSSAAGELFREPQKPTPFKPIPVPIDANTSQNYYPLADGSGPDMTRKLGNPFDTRNPPRPGVSLKSDGKGGFEFSEGVGPTTATQSAIEKDYRVGEHRLQRLNEIEALYAPDLLKWEPRVKELFSRTKENLGQELTPEETAQIDKLSEFKSAGFDLVAEYLHDLSGAAITVQEAARLLKVFPDPGTGLFDADSATQFLSKLRRVKRQTHLGLLRTDYERRHGLGLGESGLFLTDEKRFKDVLGKEKLSEFKAQGFSDDDAKQRSFEYLSGLGL